MKNNVLLKQYIFLISLFLFIGCSGDSDTDEIMNGNQDTIGQPDSNIAPAFTLKDTNDSDISLSSYKGKVVVLFFFGNGCPSCRAVAPKIQNQIVNTFSSDDVVVLGLDQWDGNLAAVNNFKSVTKVTFPLLLNASSVAQEYQTSYDRLFIIDKDGNINFKGNNLASQNLSAVVGGINNLLQ
ncbi:MAG: hypothetical protein BM563_06085 [Bacteroidetes bacterium MedPE-SWsnd-G1]|nr:MAG: hypothetical protein BM563_06085 [Bacteroidetes bacterium MedPE-SWsnd-G1]